jgi:ubiquinone/menaquinone biosynthesis C-methylase UbiE
MSVENADPVVAEYSKAAKDYDAKWSFYIEATARNTLQRLPVNPNDRVLDLGCGTGELLSRIATEHPDAILAGVDPVAEMLEIAGRKLGDRARLRVGYANALPWPDASFDTVVSSNMFHYVTHPAPSLLEIKRVLHPGGTLVITDWCDDYFACRLCNIYLRMTNRAYYKTYRQRECGDLLRAAGFGNVQIERYKINWLWGLMTAVATRSE